VPIIPEELAIKYNETPSVVAIRRNGELPIERASEAIRGHQRPSEAIR